MQKLLNSSMKYNLPNDLISFNESSKVKYCKEEHPLINDEFIVITEVGINNSFKEVPYPKTKNPILITDEEIEIFDNDVHL